MWRRIVPAAISSSPRTRWRLFGLIGAGVARLSHPIGIAFATLGVAQTMYANVLGKGRDVRFAADTPIELRLAPGRSPAQ